MEAPCFGEIKKVIRTLIADRLLTIVLVILPIYSIEYLCVRLKNFFYQCFFPYCL